MNFIGVDLMISLKIYIQDQKVVEINITSITAVLGALAEDHVRFLVDCDHLLNADTGDDLHLPV